MTPADINPWLSLLLSAIAIGGFIWSHMTSGSAKALKEIGELKKQNEADRRKDGENAKTHAEAIVARFQLLESKVLMIEGELKHLPDRDATHRLEMAVEQLNGKIGMLDERLKPVDALGRRLQEFLVRQAEARGQ